PCVALGAAQAVRADSVRRLARAQISGEKAVGDNRSALCGHAFIVEGKGPESRPVVLASIGNNIHQIAAVAKIAQLVEREKGSSGKIRFHPENTIKLDGMPDRFVNL